MARHLPPMYGKVKRKVTRVAPRPSATVDPKAQAAKELQAQLDLRKTPAQIAAEAAKAEEEAKKEARKAKRREAAAKRKAKKTAKKTTKKAAKKTKKAAKKVTKAAKKTTKKAKKKAKKTTKKAKKKVKWSEDMTQKELYKIAKKAGLDVRSKDWKHEIVAALKKAKL